MKGLKLNFSIQLRICKIFKITAQLQNLSNLKELEHFCIEEWVKIPVVK